MKKQTEKNILYCLIIIILVLTTYTGILFYESTFREILKKINIILLILFTFFLILMQKNSKEYLEKVLILIILTLFLRDFYLSFFIIIISNFVDKKIRLKILFFILCSFYSCTLVLNNLGYLEFNNIPYRKIFRHALGFNHPNTAMSLLLPIFSLLYYIYFSKYKKILIVIILIIGKIIFDFTYSRTTFLLIILFIFLIFLKDKFIEKIKFLFLIEGFLIAFLTFFLPFYFRNTILNTLFSERLALFYYYLTNHEITLFGYEKIKEFYKLYPLDNVYLKVLFENGFLGFILLIILIFITMYLFFKNKDYQAIRIFSVILIFGFMERTALYYYLNVVYFIISDYIFKNINKNYKGEKNERNYKKNIK